MKTFLYACALLLAFCGGILCTSCRTAKPAPDRAAGTDPTGPYVPVVVRPDSTARLDSVVVTPPRSLLDKVLGRTPSTSSIKSPEPYKVGKKSTINYYYGTVTTTTVGKKATAATAEGATATSIGKAKGPTAIGDSATATDNTKAGQRGGAAATAPGATATATTIKPPTPWLKYGLWAAGALTGYWILFGGGGAVLLALWRRNKSTDSQA